MALPLAAACTAAISPSVTIGRTVRSKRTASKQASRHTYACTPHPAPTHACRAPAGYPIYIYVCMYVCIARPHAHVGRSPRYRPHPHPLAACGLAVGIGGVRPRARSASYDTPRVCRVQARRPSRRSTTLTLRTARSWPCRAEPTVRGEVRPRVCSVRPSLPCRWVCHGHVCMYAYITCLYVRTTRSLRCVDFFMLSFRNKFAI